MSRPDSTDPSKERPPSVSDVTGSFEQGPKPKDRTTQRHGRQFTEPEPTRFPEDDTSQRYLKKKRPKNDPNENTQVTGFDVSAPRRFPVLVTLDGRRVSERFVLRESESTAGRDAGVTILLTDAEVSRVHARFLWENAASPTHQPVCRVEDLGSTNGTLLNGRPLPAHRPAPLHDGDQVRMGRTVFGYFVKDERLLQMDDMLLTMALHDELTGAYKREFFLAELHREIERARRHKRPLSLVLLDIDFFKSVNDELGHIAGDEALRQVANVIRVALREGDLCGRYGGEEFGIILPETDRMGAAEAAERIRRDVERYTFRLPGDAKRRITLSAGVVELTREMNDKLDLIDAADKLLYKAKQSGRNRIES